MSTITELLERTSTRVFTERRISDEDRETIRLATVAAPSAGNQQLYTVLDIGDQAIKDVLAQTCDNQPFIASAPMVWVFLADCRRWLDAYAAAGVAPRNPGLGDLILACEDAMIAAQNAVVAAHSLGIGSCYIGDIVEQRDQVVELLNLDEYVFPISLLVFGYPTSQQLRRAKPRRFDPSYIFLADTYRRLSPDELRAAFASRGQALDDFIPAFYRRKYASDFAAELNRGAAAYLAAFAANSPAS